MAVEIVTLDSPKAGALRRRAKPVGKITPDLEKLVDEMVVAMKAAQGIGLAAPQVGVSRRVIMAELEDQLHILINPRIVKREGNELGNEGCLSIPGIVAEVPRASRVIVKGKNRRGKGVVIDASGLLARIFQHEIDHLNGILITDRADPSTIRIIPPDERIEVASTSG